MPERSLVYPCGQIEVDLGRREFRVRDTPVVFGDRAFAIVAALLASPEELMRRPEWLSPYPLCSSGRGFSHLIRS